MSVTSDRIHQGPELPGDQSGDGDGTQDRENICNVAINSVGRGASQCCRIVAGNWNMEHGTILIVPQL